MIITALWFKKTYQGNHYNDKLSLFPLQECYDWLKLTQWFWKSQHCIYTISPLSPLEKGCDPYFNKLESPSPENAYYVTLAVGNPLPLICWPLPMFLFPSPVDIPGKYCCTESFPSSKYLILSRSTRSHPCKYLFLSPSIWSNKYLLPSPSTWFRGTVYH